MVRCPNCGTENPEGSAFCGNCGTPLTKATTTIQPVPQPEKKGLPLPVLIGVGALIVLVVCIGGIVALGSYINSQLNSTPTQTVLALAPTGTVSTGAATPTKSQAQPTVTSAATNTPAPPPTPTVAPSPTSAPTPAPVPSPTPGNANPTPTAGQNAPQTDYVPAGEAIYSDPFANDQGQWDVGTSDAGQAYIKGNQLHIVVTATDTSLKSLLNAPGYNIGDFVMEADVTKV